MQRKLQDIVGQEECNVDSMWSNFRECPGKIYTRILEMRLRDCRECTG